MIKHAAFFIQPHHMLGKIAPTATLMDGGGFQNEFRFQVAQRGGIINGLIMCLMMSSGEQSFSQGTKTEVTRRRSLVVLRRFV